MGFLRNGSPFVGEVLEGIESSRIVIIPLLISSATFHIEKEIPQLLEMRKECEIILKEPLDKSPRLARILKKRAMELSLNPWEEVLVLLAHGSKSKEKNIQWRENLVHIGGKIGNEKGFREVKPVLLMEDDIEEEISNIFTETKRILVIPVFLTKSYYTEKKIPGFLEKLKGRIEISYNARPIFPDPEIEEWLRENILTI